MCYLLDNEFNVVCTNTSCPCHKTDVVEKEELKCPRCGSSQHSAETCISRQEFKGTNEEFNKLYAVKESRAKRKTFNELREEHNKMWKEYQIQGFSTTGRNSVFDFWINIIKKEREELVEAIKDLSIHDYIRTDGTKCEVVALKDIFTLINSKNNKDE